MPTPYQPDLFAPTAAQRFDAWVHSPAGGAVADKFIRLALAMRRSGYGHYGAKGIAERLRWHFNIVRREGEYKINNNHTSRLARHAEDRVPELSGFFERRALKS